ncbi:MAG: prolyl-tRNA synthetase associated domain-containing protein [Candidatus Pacearchaeota archaeon]|nr:prolyl-tRNA synthetase associated domain-containing protein [Candidatus Pacearchaeota archaeon]
MDENLKNYLTKYDIKYELYSHPPVFSVEESSKIIKNIPGLRTKSLFLKDDKGKFYLVCMPGKKRLDIKSLKKRIASKKLQFASPEELKQQINLTPGSVSLFGMIYSSSVTLFIDKEVIESDLIGFHPNINTETIVLDNNNLKKFISSLKCKIEII